MSPSQRREEAITLTELMLEEAAQTISSSEKKRQQQLARMVNDPTGKVLVTRMTDQCFRSKNNWRVADQICSLLNTYGIPRFFGTLRKMQLALFSSLGATLGQYLVPLVRKVVRQETSTVILPGESEPLSRHIALRKQQGIRVNINHLGEAILGEEEAQRRLKVYLDDLQRADIDYISVKVSTIYSQINLLAWDHTLLVLTDRLKQLYRAAKGKFVNLDMEEYRDLRLTVALFTSVLDDPEFYDYSAGIVLQAYLPDSYLFQQQLTTWAMQRVANGGAPIKIRLVKGANLAMEKVEASMRCWEQAPYLQKSDADANFIRMLTFGCQPQHAAAVRLGVASHNLFDIAYALLLREENDVAKYVTFEMLEGMAQGLQQVVHKLSGGMLLYCPTATQEEFQYAVAYLTRRLDENTAPENFLRHLFHLQRGSSDWKEQVDLFNKGGEESSTVSFVPRRQQNRLEAPPRDDYMSPFVNEADTDWSLPANRSWGDRIYKEWHNKPLEQIPLSDRSQVNQVLTAAQEALVEWKKVPLQKRCRLLDEVAYLLKCRRGDLIGVMASETAKTVFEGDVEVSEAIDFANYYRRNIEEIGYLTDITLEPKGIVLVASPWNFPCSIPAGGILAALVAGNVVIFKPAPEAVLVGYELAKVFWDAGFPKNVVQFISCEDDTVGSELIKDKRVSAVILTGATDTAKKFLRLRPGIDLMAETGEKMR